MAAARLPGRVGARARSSILDRGQDPVDGGGALPVRRPPQPSHGCSTWAGCWSGDQEARQTAEAGGLRRTPTVAPFRPASAARTAPPGLTRADTLGDVVVGMLVRGTGRTTQL